MQKLVRPGLPALAWRAEGEGPAVLLLHGVGGDASNWDPIAAALRARFRVIVMDLRGHGASGPISGPITAEDLARDAIDVLDAAGAGRARVTGFSLGGAVALAMALAHPDRVERLAVIGTVCGRTDAERARALERIEFLKQNGTAAIAESNRTRWFTDEFQKAHPDVVERRVAQVVASDPASYLHAFTVFCTTDHAARLNEIRAPTLVVTGENDVAATPRMANLMHAGIAGSRLHVVPYLRHSLLIEAPEVVTGLLAGFL